MSVAASRTRTLPLVAVVYRVPLFVEAVTAAFDEFAWVQPLRAGDADVRGLLAVLRPDAVIVEDGTRPSLDVDVPVLHVDLETAVVHAKRGGEWEELALELSPEAIRNTVLRAMLERVP